MYLKNPGPWEDPTNTEEPDDGEEVCMNVLIKFLSVKTVIFRGQCISKTQSQLTGTISTFLFIHLSYSYHYTQTVVFLPDQLVLEVPSIMNFLMLM